jgi:integrase
MIAVRRGVVSAVYFPALDEVSQYRTNKSYNIFQFTRSSAARSFPYSLERAPVGWSTRQSRKALRRYLQAAKIARRVRFHDLRPTVGLRLANRSLI